MKVFGVTRSLCTLWLAIAVAGVMVSQETSEKPASKKMSGMGELAHQVALGTSPSGISQETVAQLRAPMAQSETSIAVDSTGMHVIVGFNDFRGFRSSSVSLSGFAYSDDGGKTFMDGGQLPTLANDLVSGQFYPQIFGDPDVKYLGGCSFVYSSIMLKKASATAVVETLSLHRSTDCGHTWSGPYEITPATNPNGLIDINGQPVDAADKELMDVDPETGRLIVGWANFTTAVTGGVEISIAYSDDALAGNPPAWSARRVIASTTADGQGAIPRFAGGGSSDAYVAWARFPSSYGNATGFAISHDNGATWNAPSSITPTFLTIDEITWK